MGFLNALFDNGIYSFEQAFPGAEDCTTPPMQRAIRDWFSLYFDNTVTEDEDPCQRLPLTIVSKLSKTCFAEYEAAVTGGGPLIEGTLSGLEAVRKKAMQLLLIGGEVWLKPVQAEAGYRFTVMRRDAVLVLGRTADGEVTSLGSAEITKTGGKVYTLLERRTAQPQGVLIESKLYCSERGGGIGRQAPLTALPQYARLQPQTTLPGVRGIGLVRMRVPLENCVDGSLDGVSVYAPAAGLIHNINHNEWLLDQEFDHGAIRVIAPADMLRKPISAEGTSAMGPVNLPVGLFTGLDDDTEQLGLNVFNPALRDASFLNRKSEYLRNIETVIGIKRGILSQVEAVERTAKEITSSEGDYNLTIQDLQQVWEQAMREALGLCAQLAAAYKLRGAEGFDPEKQLSVSWGNGILYDKDKDWAETMQLVSAGMLRPEIALAWRYDLPWKEEADLKKVRALYMPEPLDEEEPPEKE